MLSVRLQKSCRGAGGVGSGAGRPVTSAATEGTTWRSSPSPSPGSRSTQRGTLLTARSKPVSKPDEAGRPGAGEPHELESYYSPGSTKLVAGKVVVEPQCNIGPPPRGVWNKGNVVALVLAGGESGAQSALGPLTTKRALPAVPIAGQYRLIDVPLSNCINSEIHKIYVLTQYQSLSLSRHVKRTYCGGAAAESWGGVDDRFVEVLSPAQTPQQVAWSAGTADAVRQFSWLLEPLVGRNRYIEDILVLYSDQMYNIDFRPALKFHQQSDADVTVIARPCDEAGAEGLGLLKLERGSPRVVKVAEKPRGRAKRLMTVEREELEALAGSNATGSSSGAVTKGGGGAEQPQAAAEQQLSLKEAKLLNKGFAAPSRPNRSPTLHHKHQAMWAMEPRPADDPPCYIGSCGMYIFKRSVLLQLLKSYPQAADFGRDLLPAALEAGYAVMAYRFDGYWKDVGNSIKAFYDANLALTDEEPVLQLHEQHKGEGPLYTFPHVLPPSQLAGAQVKRSLVGHGVVLGDGSRIEHCVVGIRAVVGRDCVLEDSVVMGADYYEGERRPHASRALGAAYPPLGIGQGTVVRRAIIDKNARVGAGCWLVNAEGLWRSDDYAAMGVVIRDGIIIVSKSSVVPDGTCI